MVVQLTHTESANQSQKSAKAYPPLSSDIPPQTVMHAFAETVSKYSNREAFRFKQAGSWKSWTWKQYYENTSQWARGLCTLGVKPKDYVVILSQNCKEWVMADIASIAVGAVPAGIYPSSAPEQCAYIINHCQAVCAVVENDHQLAKIESIRAQCPSLKFVVSINSKKGDRSRQIFTWNEVLEQAAATPQSELENRIAAQKPSDLATLVYTSGTTANPKAVMLSHDNLVWVAKSCVRNDLKLSPDDILLSYLPLSHVAEQMTTIHGPLVAGTTIAFAESIEKLAEAMQEIRPTLFLGVPRVWEKIQAKMQEKGRKASFIKRTLATWAKGIGLSHGLHGNHPILFPLAEKIIFSKVKAALGLDRCRLQATAAAPIGRETLEYFLSLNIPLYEFYGMSECCGPTTVSFKGQYVLGKTGRCIEGAEVRIADDGEIIMHGRHVFMGYLHDPEATAQVLDKAGWLHSGDLGDIDADGYLSITGRKKNLIITAGGENIAPEMIENKIQSLPEIEHAVVIGDRRKYLTALLTLTPEALDIVKTKNISVQNIPDLAINEKFNALIKDQIAELNKGLAQVQSIKFFKILPITFTEASGELTPTMKVKRNVIVKKYSQDIEKLYSN